LALAGRGFWSLFTLVAEIGTERRGEQKNQTMVFIIISTFISLYGLIHYYVYRKIILVVPFGHWVIAACLALLVLAPLAVIILTRVGITTLTTPLAWVGYTWMGFVFLFFSCSLALDVLGLIGKAGARLWPALSNPLPWPWPQAAVIVAALAALGATGYGFFAARQINLEWVRIPTSKLPASSKPFRIVQITDLHLGLLTDEDYVRRMARAIQSVEPDVIVSTGDLMDMQADHLERFAPIFEALKPPLGKYAVTGNHEAYVGLGHARAFSERAGFTPLSYEEAKVNEWITLVGVDDPAVRNRVQIDAGSEREALASSSKAAFTVLLKHQPVVDKVSIPLFDLQLSGHTHGGQIFPFSLLSKIVYPAKWGLTRLDQDTWLYVSRGTGTWGPPIRFLAPPEITVIEVRPRASRPPS